MTAKIDDMRLLLAASLMLLLSTGTAAGANGGSSYGQARAMRTTKPDAACTALLRTDRTFILADHAFMDAAATCAKAGRIDDAFTAIDVLVTNWPDAAATHAALRDTLPGIASKATKSTLPVVTKATGILPKDPRLQLARAEALAATGGTAEAAAIARAVATAGGDAAADAVAMLDRIRMPLDGQQRMTVASSLLAAGRYHDASAVAGGIDTAAARAIRARALIARKRLTEAEALAQSLEPQDRLAVLARVALGRRDATTFLTIADRLPPKAGDGNYEMHKRCLELLLVDKRTDEAARRLPAVMTAYPDRAENLLWYEARLMLRRGARADALAIVRQLAATPSQEQDRYRYWLTRLTTPGSAPSHPVFTDPLGWYAIRSVGARIGGTGASEAGAIGADAQRSIERARLLRRLDMPGYANIETARMAGRLTPPEQPAVAEMLRKDGDYRSLVLLGKAAGRTDWSYPLAWIDDVRKNAAKHGVDPALVLAVMREESMMQPDVVSSAGARGLMQLMPQTAREVGLRKKERLFVPADNIAAGTAWIARLSRSYGSLPRLLAAYNAGQNAVAVWVAAGWDDDEEFMESIPYPETRGYVRKVLASYEMYKLILAGVKQ